MKKALVYFETENNGKIIVECRIAQSFFQILKGLMDVENLAEKHGMLFLFRFPWIRAFWMKNVKIPLDIIFINRKKRVINYYEAPIEKKFFNKQYWSKGFCKYVLEVNLGFCKNYNINKGNKIDIKYIEY